MSRYVVITYMFGGFFDVQFGDIEDAKAEHEEDRCYGRPSCIYDNKEGDIVAQHNGE